MKGHFDFRKRRHPGWKVILTLRSVAIPDKGGILTSKSIAIPDGRSF
jgi:hypothetical protein